MADDSQTRFLEWVFDDFHESFHRDRQAALIEAARRVAELGKDEAAQLVIVFNQANERTQQLGSYLGHSNVIGLFLGVMAALILSGYFDSWWSLAPALLSTALVLVSRQFHQRRSEVYTALTELCLARYET